MSDAETLSQVPIFKKLSKAALKKIGSVVESVRYEAGETVFAEGSAGDSLYIIVEGEVLILKAVGDAAKGKAGRGEGREKIVATLAKGDFFGEMALLDDVPRSAGARAKGKVLALKIGTKNFWQFVEEHAAEALQTIVLLARTMSERLRVTTLESTLVYELSKVFSQRLLPKELGGRIMEQVATVMPEGTLQSLALWNEFNEEYEWIAVNRPEEFPAGARRSWLRTDAVPKRLEEQKTPLVSPDWKGDKNFSAEEKEPCEKFSGSLLAVPILRSAEHQLLPSGHWIAACPLYGFFLYLAPGKTAAFDRQVLHVAQTTAQLASVALENAAHLEEELARSVHAQRRQASFES